MSRERGAYFDPRETARPFSREIALDSRQALIINNQLGLKIDKFRLNENLEIFIAHDRKEPIIFEYQLLPDSRFRHNPLEGAGVLHIRVNLSSRKTFYVGTNYRVEYLRENRRKAEFRISSVNPINLEGIDASEDMTNHIKSTLL